MKKALVGAGAVVTVAILGIVLLFGEKRVESAVVTADIIVDGMSCQGCVNKVNTALSELQGVKEVNVRLDNGVASVKYDPALVTVPDMEARIIKLGYAVGKAGASSSVDNKNECLEKANKCQDKAADDCCAQKTGAKT